MRGVASGSPPAEVRTAFGATGDPERLAGGQGTAWRLGDIVLKPIDMSEEELNWQADLLPSLRADGFRVSNPRRTGNGLLVVDDWCAWEFVAGHHQDRRWADIVRGGEAFHAALSRVPRPTFLDLRTDPSQTSFESSTFGDLPMR
jgi:hypothetical protein